MQNVIGKIEYSYRVLMIVLVLFSGFCVHKVQAKGVTQAQLSLLNPSSESTSVLVDVVKDLLRADQLEEAMVFLDELLVRLEGDTDRKAMETRAYSMFQLAHCRMKMGDYEEAAKHFIAFADTYPEDADQAAARVYGAQCLTILQQWPDVEVQSWRVLQDKLLSDELRVSATKVYSEALFRQEKWAEAVRPLWRLFETAKSEVDRSGAAVMLVTSYVRLNDFENLFQFLPRCEGDVRYDVGVNVALLEAGDAHYQEKEYQKALMLYRLVLGKDEIVEYYEGLLKRIRASIKPPVANGKVSLSDQKEANREKEYRYARKAKHLEVVRNFQDYDMDVLLRIAQSYADMDRNWPAYAIYNHIYTKYPTNRLAESSRFSAFVTLLDEKDWEMAEKEGDAYMELLPHGDHIDDVTLNLLQMHMQLEQFERAALIGQKALVISPEHKYIDQIKYLLGYILFVQFDYESALASFDEVLSRWPDSRYYESAEYWRCMSILFLGQYEKAVVSFKAYLSNPKYNDERRYAEDALYRLGIAQYGAEQYEDSGSTFRLFVQRYPESSLLSEAYAMLGDLSGEAGAMLAAIDYYDLAIEKALNMPQRNYPTFRTAEVLIKLRRNEDILALMNEYLQQWGAEGDYARACSWQGKAYKAMIPCPYMQMVEQYLTVVNRYGNNEALSGVDSILDALVVDYKSVEWEDYQEGTLGKVSEELAHAISNGQRTLEMRYETILANMLPFPDRKRYVDAVMKAEYVGVAGPSTLALMAKEAVTREQYEFVHDVYDRFMTTFPVSINMLDVMNSNLDALAHEANYEDAIALTEQILTTFGHAPSVAGTWKRRGDYYRALKQYDEAEKTYNYLLGIREWRGEYTPQAHYWLGICKMEQGLYREAYAHFQRIYVLYEQYAEWLPKAYAKSIECLKELGETEYVINTYKEMLGNTFVANSPEGKLAKEELAKLQSEGDAL